MTDADYPSWATDVESMQLWDEIQLRQAERRLAAAEPADPPELLPMLNPADWHGVETPAHEWAWHEWIPARQATYLTGPGSAGKSLFGQMLATAAALGFPFMGVETCQAHAIYLTCEDDADELHRRQKPICERMGVSLTALSGKLHLISLAGAVSNEIATFDAIGRMATTLAWRRLRATVLATGARFIVLDNVAHLFAGNENIRNQVAAFIGLLNNLAQEAGAAVLFIGHPNKAGDAFSGSTAWENQVRSRLFLETPHASDGAVPDRDARVLSRSKANYARVGATIAFRWHRGAFVRDEDLPANVAEEIAANAAAAHDNDIFLACLDERNRQERPVSEQPASRTHAPKVFAEMAESKRAGRPRMEAAMDRLFRIGAIERGFLYRDASEGKDRFGLRRASANLSADLPLTGSADLPLTTRPPPPSLTPSTYGTQGAANQAAAPSLEQDKAA